MAALHRNAPRGSRDGDRQQWVVYAHWKNAVAAAITVFGRRALAGQGRVKTHATWGFLKIDPSYRAVLAWQQLGKGKMTPEKPSTFALSHGLGPSTAVAY